MKMARDSNTFETAITALSRARTLHPRLDALAAVIEQLHGVRQRTPSRKLPSRDPVPLPLRWFHANYARSARLRGGFNTLIQRKHLAPDANGCTAFLSECAGSFKLAYRQHAADPVVWGNKGDFDTADDWSREEITVSQALAAHILSDFAICAKHQVEATRATTASLLAATKDLLALPIGWRTGWDLQLWAGRGVVVAAMRFPPAPRRGDPWEWTIFASARRRADLAYLDPLLPTWDLDNPTARAPS